MKKKPGFTFRDICGENVLIAEGLENIDFSNIIALSDTAAFLWNAVAEGEDFTADKLTQLLLDEYDVTREEASRDVESLMQELLKLQVVEH